MEDMETARVEQVTRAEEMEGVVTEAEEETAAAAVTELGYGTVVRTVCALVRTRSTASLIR